MSSNNSYEDFNTSIEDYTINELYNLLELDELSREHILLKVHDLNNNVFKNNEPIKAFFLQAQNKLLNYLTVADANLDDYLHSNANANIDVVDYSLDEKNTIQSINEFKKGFFSSSLLDKPFDLDFKFDFDLISDRPKREEISVNKLIKETRVDLKNFTIDRFLDLEQ